MRVLILGGYGLIGSAVAIHLIQQGYAVTGLGRCASKGQALIPKANWIGADIGSLSQAQQWHEHLENIDIVINASGVLQNGLSDDVAAVQRDSMLALFTACEQVGVNRFIQISAPGATLESSTLFYKTKAAADNALKASKLEWTIFRPGLVIGPYAYGGTSLMRTLAAFPIVQPIVLAKTKIQTVFIDDVTKAISLAITDKITGIDVDLVADETNTLADITLSFRRWLGFPRPIATLEFPAWMGGIIGRLADIAGWLGWRSALRTTSLKVLKCGVSGDPKLWKAISKSSNKSLAQTLSCLPSTRQERIYARAILAYPALIVTLAGFWIASGFIGLAKQPEAVSVLDGVLPLGLAKAFVWLGSVADIFIGTALLFRPTSQLACLASIFLSATYLGASAWLTPHLWVDPLGPMVKVFPVIALSAITLALTQER